jgi:hypothetical protein
VAYLNALLDRGEPEELAAAFARRARACGGARLRGRNLTGTELASRGLQDKVSEADMGEVIHVAFGTEREWEQTHAKTVDGLVTIGSLFGDDEALMRAKADCVYQILRQIVEDVPTVQITTKLPENLSTEQLDLLTGAIKEAALKGIEIAMTHSVQVLMGSIYDLCTSKLHARPS